MEAFVKEQLKATFKYAPFHWAASYFKNVNDPNAEVCRQKLGCRFMKGICHTTGNCAQVTGAGLEWERADIRIPVDKDGNIRQEYLDWKEKMREYKANGIRIMGVTPYPREFIAQGIDPRLPENEDRVREIALFLLNDLRGLVEAYQITNEMGLPQFMKPLNIREAARFIGIQLEAMYPHRGNILLGYNSSGPQTDLHALLRPYHKYCDYVGVDIYLGCFVAPGSFMYMFEGVMRYLWSMTGKPIILCEFGYISGGKPKTPEERRAVLERYGVSSEKEAREKLDMFLENMKNVEPKLWSRVTNLASGNPADLLFDTLERNHLYCELPKGVVIKKYPHTPEGQAGFYSEIFERLAKLPFVIGAFIYAWKDGEQCGYCGQADCPQETRWGLVDTQEKEKPSYYAVRDALAKIK